MSQVSSDEIIQNIKKISDKYQEILFLLMQGKGAYIPASLTDNETAKEMWSKSFKIFLDNPEKFVTTNLEYTDKFRELVAASIDKFMGVETRDLYIPNNRDRRFKDPAWQENVYFDFVKQFYLMSSEWMKKSLSHYELEPQLKSYLEFQVKQFVDAFAPTNFILGNPEVFRDTFESGWQNIVQGLDNFLNDIKESGDIFNIPTTDFKAFKVGENLAATPGKVIYQNDLIQLICYEPKEQVHKVPIFIVPPWINKYYILDLSPKNSLIKYLVDNNFQVFTISWINPTRELAHKNFEDYLKEGILEPLKYIENLGFKEINTVGYCIGGTLLAIALAYYKKTNEKIISSATFITTLLDFMNSGEVGIFINEASINVIEAEMELKGYFDGKYLSNSFSLLRANDLVWSFFVNNYLKGKTPIALDFLYWNADSSNLPAKMHSYYLRNMYLKNQLIVPGGIEMLGIPIDLSEISIPTFFLGAADDHIVPWQSVYEGMKNLKGEKTFCLASSGHVAGVVNPPAANKYNYKINKNLDADPAKWLSESQEFPGSWWENWTQWLIANSKDKVKSLDYENLKFIEAAPGTYVK